MGRRSVAVVSALVVAGGIVGVALVAGRDDGADGESAAAAEPVTTPEPTAAPTTTEPVDYDPNCTLSTELTLGTVGPEVGCLELRLVGARTFEGVPDETFDADTEAGLRAFQELHGLVVDGVLGPQTANRLGAWAGPNVLPPDPATCAPTGRSAVVDRFNQRAWLCESGAVALVMPITSAVSQPDPGTYEVYAKELEASSSLSGELSLMTHFVAFTHGEYQGARIAFHSVPKYTNGEFVQPLDTVGAPELQGESSGCIRVLPDDAVRVWDWLAVGDTVTVVS